MNIRWLAACVAMLALSGPGEAFAGWVAFIAPDFPQTRNLFAELQKRSALELAEKGLEMRFVAVPENDDAQLVLRVREAIAERPDVIFAAAERLALEAKRHTSTIPIIFSSLANPVRTGLVASLARPGGNLTGFTYDVEIESKQIELLKEIAPRAKIIGLLDDGYWSRERVSREMLDRYERIFGVSFLLMKGASPGEMAKLVLSKEAQQVDAWLVPLHNFTANGRVDLIAAIKKVRKPAVFGRTFFVEGGGLASYQEVVPRPMEIWHDLFKLVLRGTAPGDIPVRRPKDFELSLNVIAADELGIRFSGSMLRRADRVFGLPK